MKNLSVFKLKEILERLPKCDEDSPKEYRIPMLPDIEYSTRLLPLPTQAQMVKEIRFEKIRNGENLYGWAIVLNY